MPTKIKSKPGLVRLYSGCTDNVRGHFEHLPRLLEGFPIDVCLAYAFSRLELGQNMALYCGAVKIYRVNSAVAKRVIGRHRLSRQNFGTLYSTVLKLDLPSVASADLKQAAAVRDKVMHGKPPSADEIRNAIARVLEYAEEINKQLQHVHKFCPYGPLNGFAGRLKKLDERTSVFVLRGMGFGVA